MSEWLRRGPKMTKVKNKGSRVLVRKDLKESDVESGTARLPLHGITPNQGEWSCTL